LPLRFWLDGGYGQSTIRSAAFYGGERTIFAGERTALTHAIGSEADA